MTGRSRGAVGVRAARLPVLLAAAALLLQSVAPLATAPARTAGPGIGEGGAAPALAASVVTGHGTGVRPPESAASDTDGLDVATTTVYTVQPDKHRVRVTVDVTAANTLADTAGSRFYFSSVHLGVQPEATSVTATEAGSRITVSIGKRATYRLVEARFAERLYTGQTVRLRVTYTLPAGKPRSASDVRVGAAYATFVAWAFGDRGTVQVRVPGRYTVETSGNEMAVGAGVDGLQVLIATPADPGGWYAWVDATNDTALGRRVVTLGGGSQIVVRAWPEDGAWEARVVDAVEAGIPALQRRIGLPWPIGDQLVVSEVAGALLEGYAGFYTPSSHEVTVSEDLDRFTIIHEVSHVWFNGSLFTDRWISEGLADEYTSRILRADGAPQENPGKVGTSSSVAFPLGDWGAPAPIKTREQDDRETWAYDASWTVMREIVNEVGEPGMARVFAAAAAGTTVYVGHGAPERTRLPSDWRRLVDLAEEVGGGSGVAEMLAPWVLTADQRALLAPRRAARAAYRDLAGRDGTWAAPTVVRMAMDQWDFPEARRAITLALGVVGTRDAITAGAASEGITTPPGLEGSYEAASTTEALTAVGARAQAIDDSLDAVAAAHASLDAPRDWLTDLGLAGTDPAAELAAARAAWTAGDTSAATEAAHGLTLHLAVAADAGRVRVVSVAIGVLALAALAALLVLMLRRRHRHGPVATAGGPVGMGPSVVASPGSATASAMWDPASGPPPPPPGWRPPVQPPGPSGPDAYPILRPSATAGSPPEPPAPVADEGAE